jgi:CubicO group peptidase (beta-lactamase class C family)
MKLKTAAPLVVAVAALCAATIAAQSPSAPAQAPGLTVAAKAALTQQMTDAVSRGDAPGIAEIVVNRDGVLFEGAAGKLDVAKGTPMPTNAIFNIASMTKPVTSVAIMMLMEAGKLKLDDPVSKYLDGYNALQVITKFNEKDATYETRPAKKAITIRQLLAHTSGIGYSFTNPIEFALVAKTKKGEWELPLLNEPGEKWNYSASTRVLGFVVEKVTGAPLETWYQEHLFKPLVADGDAVHAVHRHDHRAAGTHRRLDPDGAFPRRRRPLLDDRGLQPVRPDAAQRRHARLSQDPEPRIGEDDGRQPDRRDLRRAPARRRQTAHQALPARRGQRQVRAGFPDRVRRSGGERLP